MLIFVVGFRVQNELSSSFVSVHFLTSSFWTQSEFAEKNKLLVDQNEMLLLWSMVDINANVIVTITGKSMCHDDWQHSVNEGRNHSPITFSYVNTLKSLILGIQFRKKFSWSVSGYM